MPQKYEKWVPDNIKDVNDRDYHFDEKSEAELFERLVKITGSDTIERMDQIETARLIRSLSKHRKVFEPFFKVK